MSSVLDAAEDRRESSQRAAIGLALVGLVGMFLALWGFTGLIRDVDKIAGMAPVLPLVVGIVLVLGAAVADAALGRNADFYAAGTGGVWGFVVNRLAPWIVVLLTAIGILAIWLRYR
ncbi:hypothetical protein ACMYYO_05035 [Dermacoccaceae bacterium W4C1]